MTRNKARFEKAVETFQNSSDMTDREAEVFVLRSLDDYSRSEAAERLDISMSTVDTLHQRAKKKAQMPGIKTVKRVGPRSSPPEMGIAWEIWFDNGAMLRYGWDKEQEEIQEDVFTPLDSDSVYSGFGVGGDEDELAEYALQSISEYTRDLQEDWEACRFDWGHIFEAITLHSA